MKKLVIFIFLFILNYSFSQKETIITLGESNEGIVLKDNNVTDFSATIKLKEIKFINKSSANGNFSEMTLNGFSHPNNIGQACIPIYNTLIEVPQNANIEIEIISYDISSYDLDSYNINKIEPTQISYSKSTDPSDMVFSIDENYYNSRTTENTPLVSAQFLGTQRGVGIGRLEVRPFRYNPGNNILEVYNNLEFKIIFKNSDISLTNSLKTRYYCAQFDYNNLLLNYSPTLQTKDSYSNYSAPLKYVIVANEYFRTTLEPFIAWKREQGYNVIEYYPSSGTGAISNTTVKSYLQNLYDAATVSDPAPLYVLLIGDHNGNYCLPAFASQATTPDDSHITDLYFCTFDGSSDYLPDMYYGRISANTTTQLQDALNKIIPYEKYTFGDGSYLKNAIMIGGDDSNYGPSHADAAVHYITNNYLKTDNGLDNIYAYYDWTGSNASNSPYYQMNSASTSAETAINSQISTGVGFANYTAHCDYYGWYDPAIRNSSISGWNNVNKYAFMIGNCCLSYQFDNSTDAFGEQVIYTANKGAINYIGASNSSYWNEDVYWGIGLTTLSITQTNASAHSYQNTGLGAYDRLWHQNGEAYNDWYYTGGQIIHAGNLAVEASSSGFKRYYWEIYHNSGDPSLMPYLTEPPQLSLDYDTPQEGSISLTVTTEPYTYVAMSTATTLLDAQWTGADTIVTLNFSALDGTAINIVGTKQNRQPYILENIIPLPTVAPTADFSGDPTTVIEGQSVTFSNLSSFGVNYLWNFGDGSTSTQTNPTKIYSTVGVYTVSLTAINSIDSDTMIKQAYITVNPNLNPPVAGFTFDVTETCTGIVQFTNTSTDYTSLSWDFGDGTNSISENPTHNYSQNGNFTVSLTATNSNGDNTFTATETITVNMPDPPISMSDYACTGNPIELSASANGSINWYDQENTLINTGTNYTYNNNITATFYLENVVTENLNNYNVGPTDKSIGASSAMTSSTYPHGLYFNAEVDLTLNSVKVFANQQVTRTINLFDSLGTLINTSTVSIPSSYATGTVVNLDFHIPAGNGYLLSIESGNNNLVRNNSGASFPYVVEDVISIYKNTTELAGSYQSGYYYFFYDWDITTTKECSSPRTQVTATVLNVPEMYLTQDGDTTLCEGESSNVIATLGYEDNYTNIYWNGSSETPTHLEETNNVTISNPGTYYFSAENICGETISSITFYQGENAIVSNISSIPCSSGFSSDGQASVEISNSNPENFHFLWSNGQETQTVENLQTGWYSVSITNINDNCETVDSVFVPIITNIDNNITDNFSLFPNPAKTIINIVSNSNFTTIKYVLFSIEGKIIEETTKNYFNVEKLSDGLYFIKVVTPDKIATIQFIKE